MIFFIFAAVHYIAAGMTNAASFEFNIGKMRMQLPWNGTQTYRR